ncbi:MAG: hypothetical protein DRN99_04715 [Thermoproteota archaeon]|nr:MAG: hypothetical protein DRN99_04715 [Candidatus Korarchaeota archaeon]
MRLARVLDKCWVACALTLLSSSANYALLAAFQPTAADIRDVPTLRQSIVLVDSKLTYLTAAPLAACFSSIVVYVSSESSLSRINRLAALSNRIILDARGFSPADLVILSARKGWLSARALIVSDTSDLEACMEASRYAVQRRAPLLPVSALDSVDNVFDSILPRELVLFASNLTLIRELSSKYPCIVAKPPHSPDNITYVVTSPRDSDAAFLASQIASTRLAEYIPLDELQAFLESHFSCSPVVAVLCTMQELKEKNLVYAVNEAVIRLDDDPYIDVPTGFLAAATIDDISYMIAASLIYPEIFLKIPNMLLLTISDAEPVALKLIRIAALAHVNSTLLTEVEGNLTKAAAVKWLSQPNSLIYIGMHGSPYSLAPSPYASPYLISSSDLPQLPPAIVFTLSCSTARLDSKTDLSRYLPAAFLSQGAVAYIGAMRVEYVAEEQSTALPDLILYLLLHAGAPLGEVVRVLNNFHISSMLGHSPPEKSAYTVLFGDPALHVPCSSSHYVKVTEARFTEGDAWLRLRVLTFTPSVYTVLKVPIEEYSPRPKVKITVNRRVIDMVSPLFLDKTPQGNVLHLYATLKVTLVVGDFSPGDIIEVEAYVKPSLPPLVKLLLIASTATVVYLVARRQFRARHRSSSKPHVEAAT